MTDGALALTPEEILAYIKIECLRERKVLEILNAIKEFDPQCAIGYSTVCRRVQELQGR